MIAKMGETVKSSGDWVRRNGHDLFVLSCVVLIAVISYNLGRMGALKKSPLRVLQGADIFTAGNAQDPLQALTTGQGTTVPRDVRVVASKNSKFYHYTWCSGAKLIKETNKIWFADETVAQKAGYTLAGNCR